MSKKRQQKRKGKPSTVGQKPIPLHKRKVLKEKQNAGGYYEGMPGVSLDENGYRKTIDFVVTPLGDSNAILFAAPPIVKKAVEQSLQHKHLRDLMLSAFVDYLFRASRNPLIILVRLLFKAKVKRRNRQYKRNMKYAAKKEETNTKEEAAGSEEGSSQESGRETQRV